MNTSSSNSPSAPLAAFLSLLIPGAGQWYLKSRWRAILIFGAAISLAFLINWGLDNFKIAQITLGGVTTSWLWIVFALFGVWSVFDAYRMAQGRPSATGLGLLLAAVILYYLAWNVTDINLDRLITRLGDAAKVANNLIHPDLFFQDEAGAWQFSDNFGDIFGRVQDKPALDLLTQFGLAKPDQTMPTYIPGKLIETIAMGLLATLFSTILALPLSFFAAHNIMARLPGGTVIYYAMRTILNVVRAVDTVIWGLLVIVWVGLGSFAGVIALTIHSVAALGKLYSEEIEHIDPGPIEAVTASGANLFQVVRYAVFPQIIPPFLAYTLLRWDINMRMATVVGFVAGGGIGFFVLETIRKGAYEQYAAALWAIAIVIIVVDYISAKWRERILVGETKVSVAEPKPFYKSPRAMVYVILGIAVFLYCWQVTGIDLRTLFEPAPTFIRLLHDFISIDLTPDIVDIVVKQMIITIFQALLATTLGALLALPFSFLAARNLTGRSRLSIWVYYLTRFVFDVLRSIEALLYVAIFAFWVGIGAFAGTLALAVTTFALIGKLYADAIENIDMGPMEAVMSTGATRLQAIVYAILPQIIPPFVSYSIYQWDINVRMATIIGFAGGGGVGLLLSTYFGMLQYHKAGTVVAMIVIVVALMDFASAKIREKMV
ncbi:MAG: phosphonate ABC transporter, permease protein PhnE [Anaerolineales bacterium]|nr:phosphonate ABC transporter, permease protein PhnE [Anaerolineales bacterium]